MSSADIFIVSSALSVRVKVGFAVNKYCLSQTAPYNCESTFTCFVNTHLVIEVTFPFCNILKNHRKKSKQIFWQWFDSYSFSNLKFWIKNVSLYLSHVSQYRSSCKHFQQVTKPLVFMTVVGDPKYVFLQALHIIHWWGFGKNRSK